MTRLTKGSPPTQSPTEKQAADVTERSRRPDARYWATPVLSVVLGLALLAGSWIGGHPGLGAVMLAVMVAFAALLVLTSGRSETVRGLLDRRDERITSIDLAATAIAGVVLTTAVIAAFVVDLARGGDGQPYAWLGAVAGVSYVAAVGVLRVRG